MTTNKIPTAVEKMTPTNTAVSVQPAPIAVGDFTRCFKAGEALANVCSENAPVSWKQVQYAVMSGFFYGVRGTEPSNGAACRATHASANTLKAYLASANEFNK